MDSDGKVIHLESIGKPPLPSHDHDEFSLPEGPKQGAMNISPPLTEGKSALIQLNDGKSESKPDALVWQEHFTTTLTPFLDEDRIEQLQGMYLQGQNPPRVSDSGWDRRKASSLDEEKKQSVEQGDTPSKVEHTNKRGGKNRKFEFQGTKVVDDRKVISEVLVSQNL